MSSSVFTYAHFQSTPYGSVPSVPPGFSIGALKPGWVTEQEWETLMAALDVSLHSCQSTVESAYRHLQLVEDLIAIHEDSGPTLPRLCETWLADKYHHSDSELWKNLIYQAWTTPVTSPPLNYFRPSLCFITQDWLSFHGFEVYSVRSARSMAFRENPQLRFSDDQGWVAGYTD